MLIRRPSTATTPEDDRGDDDVQAEEGTNPVGTAAPERPKIKTVLTKERDELQWEGPCRNTRPR